MKIFGWCSDGFHADYTGEWSAPCKGTYRRRIVDKKKRGRKVIETVLVDEEIVCECPCHTQEDVVDSDKKPRGRKKK